MACATSVEYMYTVEDHPIARNNVLTTASHRIVNPPAHPKAESICIVDSADAGILADRSEMHDWLPPSSRLFYVSKRFIKSHYLRLFRK